MVSCYVLVWLGLAWSRRSQSRPSLFPRRFLSLLLVRLSPSPLLLLLLLLTTTVCSTPTVHYCPLLSTLSQTPPSLLVSPSSSLLPSFLPSNYSILQRLRPSCDFPFYICETQSQDIRLILHTPALSSDFSFTSSPRLLLHPEFILFAVVPHSPFIFSV